MVDSRDESTRRHPVRSRVVFGWAMYDWANSAYTTLLITVLVAYIQRVVFPTDQWGRTGAVVWAWGISLSMFLGGVLSPVLGAVADAQGNKRGWLAITAFTGATASILMGIVPYQMHVLVIILFVTANLMLELSLGVYNGFLPEIVEEEDINAASAWGYGLGYLGGGLALLIAMLILQFGGSIGLETTASRLRISLVLMGLWWGLFTIPALFVLHDRRPKSRTGLSLGNTLRRAATDIVQTIKGLRSNLALALFLLSFLFYNDGVQTIISQASTFALQELAFPEADLMAVILMIQFLAFPGALIIGRGASVFGEKQTLFFCLSIWIGVLVAALFVRERIGFWMLAAIIAIVLGGTQSVSRSLMAVMTPEGQSAQYFGFFNLSGKATSFVGTFLFGAIVAITGSSRLAIFSLMPLFAMGIILLTQVNVQQAKRLRTPGQR